MASVGKIIGFNRLSDHMEVDNRRAAFAPADVLTFAKTSLLRCAPPRSGRRRLRRVPVALFLPLSPVPVRVLARLGVGLRLLLRRCP
eukprot:14121946-Heterocapsa_arctica.AAC.1